MKIVKYNLLVVVNIVFFLTILGSAFAQTNTSTVTTTTSIVLSTTVASPIGSTIPILGNGQAIQINPDNIPNIISGLSLIVSILAFIFSWLAYKRDEGKLVVKVGFLLKSGQGTEFVVHVANAGRRLIQVQKVYLCIKSGKRLPYKISGPMPVALNEADNFEFQFPLYSYQTEIDSPLDFRSAEVIDSLNRRYVFPRYRVNDLWQRFHLYRQISKQWTPENDWLSEKKHKVDKNTQNN